MTTPRIEEMVEEILLSSSGLPYGITIGFNQDVLGQRQGFQKCGGDELKEKIRQALTKIRQETIDEERKLVYIGIGEWLIERVALDERTTVADVMNKLKALQDNK